MPLNRLRRVLSSSLEITVNSTDAVAAEVNARLRPHLLPKLAAPFPPVLGVQTRQVRPIDLLRKIGELTTPRSVNLARLSSSWATRRYFWCIHDYGLPGHQGSFRLSKDARNLERHQKTLLSDEFGIGFAALLMEQIFGASRTVDMQFALCEPAEYFDVTRGPSKREPDYLMWAPGGPVYIVECKGCQTGKGATINQLRRGMEQVPTISIPGSLAPQLVVATHLGSTRTIVYILDPPDELSGTNPSKGVERRSNREFVVSDPISFRTKLQRGTNLQNLRWISQHTTAARLEFSVGYRSVDPAAELPNAALRELNTDFGEFVGIELPLAPELGPDGPTLFRGIEREHHQQLVSGDLEAESVPQRAIPNDPTISMAPDGACLAVRHLSTL